jgi:hypothetical protein
MLSIKNVAIDNLSTVSKRNQRFIHMKNQMDLKAAAYLRYLATKNAVNRASDYHYLCLAVTNSTAPVNGIDYIHPSVKPAVDYMTSVVCKGLAQNGDIIFEFVADSDGDEEAAKQATDMVSRVINEQNNPHFILQRWVMDAALHKNGMMMIKPIRETVTRYVTTQGTADQLAAFEAQAVDGGLVPLRQSKKKLRVDIDNLKNQLPKTLQELYRGKESTQLEEYIKSLESHRANMPAMEQEEPMPEMPEMPEGMMPEGMMPEMPEMPTKPKMGLDDQEEMDAALEALNRNTIYEAKYKLTGHSINIQFRPIAQHYWICDPTVQQIKDQPFCGFYDPMTIQQATELYPDIDLEEFQRYAEYNQSGAYQAGSVLNNMAIHARDSVPIMGVPVDAAASADPYSRQVTILTVWDRYDIDDDGELELIEIIYSGQYIISAREVEFIPVANMCPKPLPGNFYGMSIAESVVPMQEYMTSASRAEIQLGLLTATPRIGVKPDRVDFEMIQDGESAIFILDSKFDPATDVYAIPPPSGQLGWIENAMTRMQQDTMSMIGMTQPADVFNPEIMNPGNSGIKLQMSLGPNQIIQDNTIKNCADGLREAIWLVWRTLIQYGDEYGVKRLAQMFHPDKKAEFIDYKSFDDMNFAERKLIHIDLAMGMSSDENRIQKQQIIQKCQIDLYATVTQMVGSGTLTPTIYKKIKRPFADTLYTLGIKDCDSYLPSDEEVVEMIKQAQQAAQNRQPAPPADQVQASIAELNKARAAESAAKTEELKAKTQATVADTTGESAERQLELASLALGTPRNFD